MKTNAEDWKNRWGTWCRPTKVPGIFERREGGYLARKRVTVKATGQEQEIKRVLPNASLGEALKWLEEESARVRGGNAHGQQPKQRFADFAVDLLERKVKAKEIRSESGRQKWVYTLTHLIDGTRTEDGELIVEGFGEFFVDEIRTKHIEAWKAEVTEKLIAPKLYAPTTANGWLSVLKVLMGTARRELELDRDASDGVRGFDTSEHVTYTDDEPNSLTGEEVRSFLGAMKTMYPQHYGMTALSFATGLRPSSLRPLRRRGPDADILWDAKQLLVRRSQTRGERAMERTKTGVRQRIHLPEELVEILKWHVDTQLQCHDQQESDLLFPSITGGFRSPSVLNKPFEDVANEIGLTKKFTQRGMRRTFNDLARAASVESLVTRSISGHLTETMKDHYSTVQPTEQRAAIAKVIDLAGVREARGGADGGASSVSGGAFGR